MEINLRSKLTSKTFLKIFFETLGNPKASPLTKGRQKRVVSRLKSIYNNTTKKTNGAILVTCALIGYTTLTSKLRLDQGVLLLWYKAEKADQFVR
jgi:hypothetical protein